jgi:hypothetical protein
MFRLNYNGVLFHLGWDGNTGQGFLALLFPEAVLIELLLAVPWVCRGVAVSHVQELPHNFNVVVLKQN